MITTINILFIVFYSKSDRQFDTRTYSVNLRILYKFHGYVSFANEGPSSGCCGDKVNEICMPCQYEVNIYKVSKHFLMKVSEL
ncbi:hypothetical protein HZS_4590 [Henneguya salminicola]|nr:hypothetical protein HZS_4590 [Henneguya salminicola]